MLNAIRYAILMRRLRAEIVATVRENRAKVRAVKTACKAIESIV